ncbi:MAG: DUF4230 domain-containing protein [Lachnospiraceae bacterium]|nr:DUF4230 domain-containing protein [Lachnospiraceae bacterium]
MKKYLVGIMLILMTLSLVACGDSKEEKNTAEMEPKVTQMQSICNLSVMECYYHNVAKYFEEDAEGFLFWEKDKKFWIEYSGVVTIGVNASLVSMEVDGTTVTITIPEAEVLQCEVDENSLSPDSFVVDSKSADITAEDQTYAFEQAQSDLWNTAASDTALLSQAQERTKELLEGYVNNIGDAFGIEYTVNWVYVDTEGNYISGEKPAPDEEDMENKK